MKASIVQKDDSLQEAVEVSQTFFVAPDGDDRGDGTMEHPFATIERAIQAAEANGRGGGDQILLREGTYYPAGPLMLNEKGTPQRWSRLAAWDGERTVIDGHRIPDAEDGPQSMIYVHGSYYELSGLELVSSRKSAISLYGEHVRVIGNVIHDSMGGAVYADPRQAAFLFFAGNVVHHNCLSNQKRNMPSGWPSAVNLTHRGDIVVDNLIYENYGEGIGAYGASHYIAGNDLHDNFGVEIYLSNVNDTIVQSNFIHSDGNERYFRDWNLKEDPQAPPPFPFFAPSEAIGMANENPNDTQFAHNRVIDNIIAGPHLRGLSWWNGTRRSGGMQSSLIAHNTVVPEAEAVFHLDDNHHVGTMIVDNIFIQLRPDRRLTDFHGVKGIEFSHNLLFGGDGSSGPAGDGSGPGDVRTDPRLIDPRGRRACDFALRPDSPAIDAGTPVGVHLDYFGNPRPFGPRYDIGAHEWSKDTEG